MRLLSGHILPRNTTNLTCTFEKFFRGRNPGRTSAYRDREKWKTEGRGSHYMVPNLQRKGEGKDSDRGGTVQGQGVLLQGLRGIDAPHDDWENNWKWGDQYISPHFLTINTFDYIGYEREGGDWTREIWHLVFVYSGLLDNWGFNSPRSVSYTHLTLPTNREV